ncbi:twin-arginine translocation signal domain-containing protein [Pseudothauera nasutitermitis]|uniref:Twin-arginine translocation signal domain-containing protein n=1 Tax=Pseudothauera nasutitermitis TaxID=2565930 RepID=A0A4S4ARH6_9RHOO|nr:thiosulfate oxidation carrier protein SoxY [Pseudothauera nasutitermitis]THF62433.1 twin-arginine translocation signal domain-containing protein [Pseudothauera nasutitermitis]
MNRRRFLHHCAALGALLAGGLPLAARAAGLAARPPFEAKTLAAALQALGASETRSSADLLLEAPDVAENGASVPLDITSKLPDTRRISVLVDDNPQPLAMQLEFSPGVQARFHGRVKLNRSSTVRVLAEAGDAKYLVSRPVQVTIGGCGV